MTAILSFVWVATCALYNLKEPRIPNSLILIGFGGAIWLRIQDWQENGLIYFHILNITAAWILWFLFWKLRWWGGGDAKFMMVVTLAFPDLTMISYMMIMIVIGSVIVMTKEYGWNLRLLVAESLRLRTLENSTQRLRAVTFLGAGWIIWFFTEI